MLKLNIRTTNITLNMSKDWGSVDASFDQPSGRGDYIQPQNRLEVTSAEVKIDSTHAREALGIYTNTRRAQLNATEGKQALSSGIARVMKEARTVMKNGAKSNAIVNVERQHLLPKQKQLTVTSMPSAEITVIPSEVNGEIIPGHDKIESIPGKYNMNYTPAKVDISVDNYSSVKMWTSGNEYSIYA
ncbi:DUF6470 family protein [Pectinatus haikarae]|uniref:Uncharacterized protein n=1 Tax=Pectinatus haikarae TaxID=349096 RepID=A0ABT9Y4T0_9FIRM|nr:DUF6470 family protein [Pectinatus haikarae]MDQ0202833.1 hypothetical protein [Pectinatus haikarae]